MSALRLGKECKAIDVVQSSILGTATTFFKSAQNYNVDILYSIGLYFT
jgi:hypothetical protein